jgi:hypothetical protein
MTRNLSHFVDAKSECFVTWQKPSKRFENDGFESGGIMQKLLFTKVCAAIERVGIYNI